MFFCISYTKGLDRERRQNLEHHKHHLFESTSWLRRDQEKGSPPHTFLELWFSDGVLQHAATRGREELNAE